MKYILCQRAVSALEKHETRKKRKEVWLNGRAVVLNSVFREDFAKKVTPNQGQKEELEEHSRPREEAPNSKTLNSPGGVGERGAPQGLQMVLL